MTTYDGTNIANLGETILYIRHDGINHKVKFHIAKLLGCNDSQSLGYAKFLDNIDFKTTPTIRSKQEIRTQFPDLLDTLSKFPWEDYHINIDKDVPPERTASSQGSAPGEGRKEEIDKMLASGLIVLVEKPYPGLTAL